MSVSGIPEQYEQLSKCIGHHPQGDLMETEDHELQRAIELSLVAAEQQTEVGLESEPSQTVAAKSTKGRKNKKQRTEIAPPTSEEMREGFKMLDPKGRGTISISQISEIAPVLLGRELTEREVYLMKSRAEEILQTEENRACSSGLLALPFDDFQNLVNFYSKSG